MHDRRSQNRFEACSHFISSLKSSYHHQNVYKTRTFYEDETMCHGWSMSAHCIHDMGPGKMDVSTKRQHTTYELVEVYLHYNWNNLDNEDSQRLLSMDDNEIEDSGIDTEC